MGVGTYWRGVGCGGAWGGGGKKEGASCSGADKGKSCGSRAASQGWAGWGGGHCQLGHRNSLREQAACKYCQSSLPSTESSPFGGTFDSERAR